MAPAPREPSKGCGARPRSWTSTSRHRGDLHDVAGVRSVDELAAADVDADVAETVEEDEVARLELIVGHGNAHAVLRIARMRERHADLRVGVHHEAGAVEASRRRSTPHVRGAEVLHRYADDSAVVRGRGLNRRRRLRLWLGGRRRGGRGDRRGSSACRGGETRHHRRRRGLRGRRARACRASSACRARSTACRCAISSRTDTSRRLRSLSCASIERFSAARCATTWCCSVSARCSLAVCAATFVLKPLTSPTTALVWSLTRLTVSMRLSRSSRFDAPSNTSIVEFESLDV